MAGEGVFARIRSAGYWKRFRHVLVRATITVCLGAQLTPKTLEEELRLILLHSTWGLEQTMNATKMFENTGKQIFCLLICFLAILVCVLHNVD